MQLQFGLLHGDLVISNGVEAWVLRDGRWERTDAPTAFVKSTQLKPREARRAFGEALPDLPPEAFASRKVGPRGLSRWGPVRRYVFYDDEIAEAEAQGLPYVEAPRLLSTQEWMEEYGGQPAAEASPGSAPAADTSAEPRESIPEPTPLA